MVKVKASDLVFDWNIYPRYNNWKLNNSEKFDSTNLSKIKKAITAGVSLPPVLVNEQDNRIVDGFHRVKSHIILYKSKAVVDVVYKTYKSESEMFLDAAHANNNHGLPLSPRDIVFTIVNAINKFNIPITQIALVLGMDPPHAETFINKRTATNLEGEVVCLSGGCLNLANTILTKEQEAYTRFAPGYNAQTYATLLLRSLKAGAVDLNNPGVVETLKELYLLIEKILSIRE
jgi:hypothetical protein